MRITFLEKHALQREPDYRAISSFHLTYSFHFLRQRNNDDDSNLAESLLPFVSSSGFLATPFALQLRVVY